MLCTCWDFFEKRKGFTYKVKWNAKTLTLRECRLYNSKETIYIQTLYYTYRYIVSIYFYLLSENVNNRNTEVAVLAGQVNHPNMYNTKWTINQMDIKQIKTIWHKCKLAYQTMLVVS